MAEKVKSEIKSTIAESKPRDSEGHFVHVEKPGSPPKPQGALDKFFGDNVRYHKSQDDLLDVRVGNPLRKIVELLEDIKRQKAFSFTLKGSLGIAGVALALGVFGVFGGGKILCEKGVQSYIGTVKTLNVMEQESSGIPVLSQFLDYFAPKQTHNKVVLVKNDESVISLPFSSKVDYTKFSNFPVIVTGNYNSCSQTLTLSDPSGLQIYSQ
ncbi:MAG: hypothetical protein A2186_00760 [Candidatus Levybacteria bacterium RIFOXYA1_FULL_41_10]|nr:MAG: hypothetical protein UT46_C0003G0032 [Candidatus Levybacteria bacterium GW2011_GWA1_39_34]KKR50721.1 MAG: hypothetical protein UT87_C0013G0013 [Candidatus Levybacteria bacterium GW2011_GWC1_40_19]KKR72624.1 MAG: hypothetical protein UU15_C0027G0014 [Candidatus Levybacteria bacterium GW2011_GWC2_40_7]KKR95321.1 MAG: hypothetical protein UU45_C0002G0033 [Candidatus Levybacteria bacterium GW2011_GWA2_41_15]OGH20248.1 MAG: hypothetical protein A2695_02115 [Candidatus Levybacteria bacterium 